MKKLIIIVLTFIIQLNFGQNQKSDQNNTYFIYAKGSSARFGNEKVLLVASEIISFKNVKSLRPHLKSTLLSLAFSELKEKVFSNEQVDPFATYYNMSFGSPQVESAIGNAEVHSSDRLDYGITEADSKLEAIEKIRKVIISNHLNEGYKVYQVKFNPLNYVDMQGGNAVDDDGKPLVYLPQSKLSELWIPPYIKGEIKTRMSYLRNKDDSNNSTSANTSTNYCTSSSAILITTQLQDSYNHYLERGGLEVNRSDLIQKADEILYLCPYNITAQNIRKNLQESVDREVAIVSAIIENSSSYEMQVMRSILENDAANNHNGVFTEFSLMMKFHYGIPEIAFIAGAGFSILKYPNYIFTYDQSKYTLDNLPKENVPYEAESGYSMDIGLGVRGQIPLIKSKTKGDHAKLGLVLEGMVVFSYGGLTTELTSLFPDLPSDFSMKLRGTAGFSFLVNRSDSGNSNYLQLSCGIEQYYLKDDVSGIILDTSIPYSAKIVDLKSISPFIALSYYF